MMRSRFALIAVLLLGAARADAASIQLTPSSLTVTGGDAILFDLVVSDLGSAVVGDFDVDISFDSTRLTLGSFAPSGALGSIAGGEALYLNTVSPGLLNIAVVSFLTAAELDALQGDPVTLATIGFTVGSLPGGQTTSIGLTVNALGDGAGVSISLATVLGTTLTGAGSTDPPTDPPQPIPEPGSILLCLSGLSAWLGARVSRRQRNGGS